MAQFYHKFLLQNPVFVKSVTSGLLTTSGDLAAQAIRQHYDPNYEYDPSTTLKMAIFGFTIPGPLLHYWYGYLERVLPGTALPIVVKKIAIDAALISPLFMTVFTNFSTWWEHPDADSSVYIHAHKERFWPSLKAAWSLWPFSNLVNFYFIPLPYRVAWTNSVGLVWNTWLAFQWTVPLVVPDNSSATQDIQLSQSPKDSLSSEKVTADQ